LTRYRQPYPGERSATPWPARVARLLLAAGLLLLILWLVVSAIRLARAASSLQQQQQRVETLLEAGLLDADPAELEQIALAVRNDVAEIRRVVGPLAPLGRYLGWIPGAGPLLRDARPLLDMADAGSELAVYGVAAVKPLLVEDQQTGALLTQSLPQAISALEQAQPYLRRADVSAGRLLEARAALEGEDRYPDRLSSLLSRFDENVGLLQDGFKLAQAAPALLGSNGSRTYLILAQNEDELRPTGGFISGAGLLTLDRGRITGISFSDAYAVDDWQHKPYDLPPAPFAEFMGMDIFLFRDANFWPDFPQSAAQAQALYTYSRDVPLDGVVAIDQHFLQELLAVTGPLPVPDLDRIVSAGNVIDQLREEWGSGGEGENWISERKAFMAPLAAAFLAQWQAGAMSAGGLDLATMLQRAAQQRHLQIYSSDPAVARLLDPTVWSGRFAGQDGGDFLSVADTNMGFNKVNAVVQRSLTYQVNLEETGSAVSRLDIHYSNPPSADNVACQHGTRYAPDTQYESLTSGCYWNYLRAYVPLGSQLTWSSQHPVPAANLMSGLAWPGISRTGTSAGGSSTYFDNFILLETGQQTTVSFEYKLPDKVLQIDGRQYNYHLLVRKQAGTTADPLAVQVTIPDRARLRDVTPRPDMISGNTLHFNLALENDIVINVAFER
jgi:hypothetical protein